MSQSNLAEDLPEDQLNRAIEELRGALREDKGKPDAVAAAAGAGSAARPAARVPGGTSVIMNIPVEVQIVLGSTEMAVSDLMALQRGSTVSLNRRIGEPVDMMVNGRQIARGEIVVMDNDPSRFGIKLTEIIAAKAG